VVGRLLFLRQTRISVSRKIQFGGQIIKRKKTRSTKHFVSWWIVTGHKKQKSTFCYNNPIVIFYFVILRSMVEGAGSTDIALCVNQLTIPLTIWPSGWVLIFFNIPPSPIPSTISVHPFRQRRKIFVFFFLESKLLPRNYLFSPTTKRKKKKIKQASVWSSEQRPPCRPPLWKHSALFNFFTLDNILVFCVIISKLVGLVVFVHGGEAFKPISLTLFQTNR
jgi:hypothetical protein